MTTNSFGGTYRSRKILVTGHTGFKGAWLTYWLVRLSAEVYGVSLPAPISHPNLFGELGLATKCHDIRVDISVAHQLETATRDIEPDLILHLAAQSTVMRGYRDPYGTYLANALGTANVIENVRRLGWHCPIVVVTSDKCYRNDGASGAFREGDPLGGNDPYSASKAAAELVVAGYREVPDMPPIVTVRAGNVIGGGDWGEDRLVSDTVRALHEGKEIALRNPDYERPWYFVLDSLAGYLEVGRRLLSGRAISRTFNFGPEPDQRLSVRGAAECLRDAWGCSKSRISEPCSASEYKEAAVLALDSTRAREELGWCPVIQLEEAVERTAKWYRAFYEDADVERLCENELLTYETTAAARDAVWAFKD